MSLSTTFRLFPTKFPQSLFNPSSPVFKTLTSSHHHHHPVVPLLPSSTPLSFFKSITIQPIPTNSSPVYSTPNSSSSAASASLQSIEELPPKLQEIVKLFQSVQEPKAKYQQLLFYGKGLPPLDPQFKTTENKVQGCVSQVWVRAYLDPENKNVTFEADSDSVLTKGLAALLVNGLSGQPVDAILRVSPDFIVLLGLQQSLTPSRNNGFLNMLNLMQNKAKKLHLQAKMGIGQEFESEKDVKSRDLGSGNDDGVEEVKVGSSSNEGIVNEQQPNSSVLGSRGERIKEILGRELQPVELEVEDLSYQHAGHAGVRGSDGETHFNLKVISKEFEGKSLVKRHRLIYGLLEDELQSGLHALSIVAKTPAEVGG